MEPKHYALSLGALLAALHLAAVLIISLSNGSVLNFWLKLHHLQMDIAALPLSIGMLIGGTVLAGTVGALIGFLFGTIAHAVERRL